MNITIRMTITVDRADGSHTDITEERTRHASDNPRMERDEIGASIVPVVDAIMARYPAPAPTPADVAVELCSDRVWHPNTDPQNGTGQ